MKTAIIKSKNDITKQLEIEGRAILGSKMDSREGEAFYEVKFNDGSIHCRWVREESILIEGEN